MRLRLVALFVVSMAFVLPSQVARAAPSTPHLTRAMLVELRWDGFSPYQVYWYLQSDGTFSDSDGYMGTWSFNEGTITVAYEGVCGAVYTGQWFGSHFEGTMQACGSHGIWRAKPQTPP